MDKIKLLIKYILYRFRRRGSKGHGIHSPFVYMFNRNVLNSRIKYPEYREIMNFRRELLSNRENIRVQDYGAGSLVFSSDLRRISAIARHSSSNPETGKLLFRLARHIDADNIVELGTSLGFGTFCLARGAPRGKVYSIEACSRQLDIARRGLANAGIRNIELIHGQFEEVLPQLLGKLDKVDLVYFDGDHRKEALLWQVSQCMEKAAPGTVFVAGDIHWSGEMDEAWKILFNDPAFSLSLDLFYCGLLLFRKGIAKQHIILGYSG
jgi:predicted O-methyltransferase YrrM